MRRNKPLQVPRRFRLIRTLLVFFIALSLFPRPLPLPQAQAGLLAKNAFLAPPSRAVDLGDDLQKAADEAISELSGIVENFAEQDEDFVPLKRVAIALTRRIKAEGISPVRIRRKNELMGIYRSYFRGNAEQQKHTAELGLKPNQVGVYWCTEFGVADIINIFSGGLGILAGDTVRAISDFYSGRLDVENPESDDVYGPMVSIGLAYSEVYQEQALEEVTGYPTLRYPRNPLSEHMKFARDPRTHEPLLWDIPMPDGQKLFLRAYVMRVGRAKVLLVTTDIPENDGKSIRVEEWGKQDGRPVLKEWDEPYRRITDRLYTGSSGTEKRFLQEYVLGIGGSMLLEKLGLSAKFHHLNEGHSALGVFGMLRQEMESRVDEVRKIQSRFDEIAKDKGVEYTSEEIEAFKGMEPDWAQRIFPSLETARQSIRRNVGFTSHTPVPAGNELFDQKYFDKYMHPYFERYSVKTNFSGLISQVLEHVREPDGRVNFSTLAIFFADILNGVARQNKEVTNKLYKLDDYRKGQREGRTGFIHVTNAVHTSFWQAREWRKIFKTTLSRLRKRGEIPKEKKRLEDLNPDEYARLVAAVSDDDIIKTKDKIAASAFKGLNEAMRRNRIITKLELVADKPEHGDVREAMNRLRKLRLEDLVKDDLVAKYVDTKSIHGEDMDPEGFIVSIARRFATYKRSDLSLLVTSSIVADQIMGELTKRESIIPKKVLERARDIAGKIQEHEKFIFGTDAWILSENGYAQIEDKGPQGAFFAEKRDEMHQRARAINLLAKELEDTVRDVKGLKIAKFQQIFAGKAHPRDEGGAKIISRIVERMRSSLEGHVFFIEDYDIEISRFLQMLSTIWLNNPIAPKEASQTSGMKAQDNGAICVSSPDGWVLEALVSVLLFNRLDELKAIVAGPPRVTVWRRGPDGQVVQEDIPLEKFNESLPDPNVWCCYNPMTNDPAYPDRGKHPHGPNSFNYWVSDKHQDVCPDCEHWAIQKAPYQVRGLLELFKNRDKKAYKPHWANLIRKALIDGATQYSMKRMIGEYHEKVWLPLAQARPVGVSLRDRLRTHLKDMHDTVNLHRYKESRSKMAVHVANKESIDGKIFRENGAVEVTVEVRADGLGPQEIVPVIHFGRYHQELWEPNDTPMEFFEQRGGKYIFRKTIHLGPPGDYGMTVRLLPSRPGAQKMVSHKDAAWHRGGDMKFTVLPAAAFPGVETESLESAA